jgi:hypothetical protein
MSGDLHLDPFDDTRVGISHEGAAHAGLLRRGRGEEQVAQVCHGLRGSMQPG